MQYFLECIFKNYRKLDNQTDFNLIGLKIINAFNFKAVVIILVLTETQKFRRISCSLIHNSDFCWIFRYLLS